MKKVSIQRVTQPKENITFVRKMNTRKNKNSTKKVTKVVNQRRMDHSSMKMNFIR